MSEELRETLGRIIESGYQLSVDGFEYLRAMEAEERRELVGRVLQLAGSSSLGLNVLDRAFIEKVGEERPMDPLRPKVFTGKGFRSPLASQYEKDLQVLDKNEAEPAADLDGFIDYFRSRYRKLETILRRRIDVRDAVSIGSTLKMPMRSKVKVIGLVTNKRSSGSRLFVELEDSEDSITAMASNDEVVRRGLSLLVDQVICVDALKIKQDLLVVNDFIWPDIPSRPPNRSKDPLCGVFLADVHIGSDHFRRELFTRFIRWMNREVGPPAARDLAGRVKYLVVAGDLVDGIGVYPEQMEELEIKDVRKQYEAAYLMLSELPDYVEVIVIPGNHDAVRKSLPQPPISGEYAEAFQGDERFHLLDNPSRIQMSGVEAFVCHGKALDEILASIPGMDFHKPLDGVELLLRCRHVAPTYGASTPIAPEKEDRLVVSSVPDIFQMGHIHVHGTSKYKGTTLIASGSWQGQTPFQKKVDLEPTVGVAPIVDLQTHQVIEYDFKMLG